MSLFSHNLVTRYPSHADLCRQGRDNCSGSSSLTVHGDESHRSRGAWRKAVSPAGIREHIRVSVTFTFIKSLKPSGKIKMIFMK